MKPTERARSLRQEEIDAHHRQAFVSQVLTAMTMNDNFMHQGPIVRFALHKQHYTLVEIRNMGAGEFEFHVGAKYRYCYRMSLIVDLLEKIYDSDAEVLALRGELDVSVIHATANPDAEPNTGEAFFVEVNT